MGREPVPGAARLRPAVGGDADALSCVWGPRGLAAGAGGQGVDAEALPERPGRVRVVRGGPRHRAAGPDRVRRGVAGDGAGVSVVGADVTTGEA